MDSKGQNKRLDPAAGVMECCALDGVLTECIGVGLEHCECSGAGKDEEGDGEANLLHVRFGGAGEDKVR